MRTLDSDEMNSNESEKYVGYFQIGLGLDWNLLFYEPRALSRACYLISYARKSHPDTGFKLVGEKSGKVIHLFETEFK